MNWEKRTTPYRILSILLAWVGFAAAVFLALAEKNAIASIVILLQSYLILDRNLMERPARQQKYRHLES